MKPPLFIVLLFIIIGGGRCTDQKYEYIYKVDAVAGMPTLKHEGSVSVLHSNIAITETHPADYVLQLNDPKVGEYQGELLLPLNSSIKTDMRDVTDEAKHLNSVFTAHLNSKTNSKMTMSKNDTLWITNIKKGVVNVFRLFPLRHTFSTLTTAERKNTLRQGNHTDHPVYKNSFNVMESTIFGECENKYTILQVSPNDFNQTDKELKDAMMEDFQSPKNSSTKSAPKVSDILWKITMVTNFDNCSDMVFYQRSNIMNTAQFARSDFEDVQSRTFEVNAFIRGNVSLGFRLENYTAMTTVITFPYGSMSDPIHLYTRQQMNLLKAGPQLKHSLKLESGTTNYNTWKFSVKSPVVAARDSPRWVIFEDNTDSAVPIRKLHSLLGHNYNDANVTIFKDKIHDILSTIAKDMRKEPTYTEDTTSHFGSNFGTMAANVQEVADILGTLTYNELIDIYNSFKEKDYYTAQTERTLFMDAIAASGAGAGLKMFVHMVWNDTLPWYTKTTMFLNTPSMWSPGVLKNNLWDVMRHLYLQVEPYETSTALINVATLTRRLCVDSETRKYSIPSQLFGAENNCTLNDVIDGFLHFLIEKFDSCTDSWERVVVLQALGNLGMEETYTTLKAAAMGLADHNPGTRVQGIYNMQKGKLPESMRDLVTDFLTTILIDTVEPTEIRSAAYVVLLQWGQSFSWWQNVAKMTWTEKDPDIMTLICSTTYAMSQGSSDSQQKYFAERAYKLLLPWKFTASHSFNSIWNHHNHKDLFKSTSMFAWFGNMTSLFPQEIYASLSTTFGGVNFDVFQMALSQYGIKKLINFYTNPPKLNITGYHGNKKINLQEEWYAPYLLYDPHVNVFLRFLNNYQLYLPMEKVPLNTFFDGENPLQYLINKPGFDTNKFMNPLSFEAVMPSGAGLPMLHTMKAPTLYSANGALSLSIKNSSDQSIPPSQFFNASAIKFSINSHIKISTNMMTFAEVWTPWSNQTVGSGVSSEQMLNLPINLSLSQLKGDLGEVEYALKTGIMKQKKFPAFYSHVIPTHSITPIDVGQNFTREEGVKVILKDLDEEPQPLYTNKQTFGEWFTGMIFEYERMGDTDDPFTMDHLIQVLESPQEVFSYIRPKSTNFRRSYFNIDSENSKTKFFVVKLNLQYPKPIPDFSMEDSHSDDTSMNEDQERQTQTKKDSFYSDDFEDGYYEEKESALNATHPLLASIRPQFSSNMTFKEKLKLIGDDRSALYQLTVDFEGPPTIYRYQAVYVRKHITNGIYYGDFGIIKTKIHSHDFNRALCGVFRGNMDSPHDMKSLESVINSDAVTRSWQMRLVNGTNACYENIFGTMGAGFHISSKRLDFLKKQLENSYLKTTNDPTARFRVPAIFDDGSMRITYDNETPEGAYELGYWVYDFIIGLMGPTAYTVKRDFEKYFMQADLYKNVGGPTWEGDLVFPASSVHAYYFPAPDILTNIVPFGGIKPFSFTPSQNGTNSTIEASFDDIDGKTCNIFTDNKQFKVEFFNGTKEDLNLQQGCYQIMLNQVRPKKTVAYMMVKDHVYSLVVKDKNGNVYKLQLDYVEINGRTIPANQQNPNDNQTFVIRDDRHKGLVGVLYISKNLIDLVFPWGAFRVHKNYVQLKMVGEDWVADSFGLCGAFGVKKKDKLIDFQDLMPPSPLCTGKIIPNATFVAMPGFHKKGSTCRPMKAHRVIDETEHLCVSDEKLVYCPHDACTEQSAQVRKANFLCWKKDSAPDQLNKSLSMIPPGWMSSMDNIKLYTYHKLITKDVSKPACTYFRDVQVPGTMGAT